MRSRSTTFIFRIAGLLLLVVLSIGASVQHGQAAAPVPDSHTAVAPTAAPAPNSHTAMAPTVASASESNTTMVSTAAPADEIDRHKLEEYWQQRLTYPVGRLDPAWVRQAADQDSKIVPGVPSGTRQYSRSASLSPMALDPDAFTALGPAPEQSSAWGPVAGLISGIIVHPTDPSIAYVSAAGGIWKTTNCCSTPTTWVPILNDPLLETVGIDNLAIQASNGNVLYAGTGSRYIQHRSYPSQGILRSTDAGASWTRLGESWFSPYQTVTKVQVDPGNNQRLIAGTIELPTNPRLPNLHISKDSGATWASCWVGTDPHGDQWHHVTDVILKLVGISTEIYVAVGTLDAGNVNSGLEMDHPRSW